MRKLLLYGGAMLGLAAGLERLLTFLSTMLAARIGGPQTFGGYSLALTTAGTVAAYAGAGIGVTAVRFSGDYPQQSPGYARFVRALTIVSISSAVLAAAFMFAGAGPIARGLFHNEALANFLRVAAISSAAFVLLECCRGLLLGQQRFHGLLVLSLVSGLGLIVALPIAARVSAGAMIAVQGLVALTAVMTCVLLAGQLGLKPRRSKGELAGPGIRPVITFGVVQFSAFAGISIASWWIASLVARSDPSLNQMGFYAIANQFRGIAALAPGFLAQVVYSSQTNESGAAYGGAARVLLSSTIINSLLVMAIAGLAIVVLPWGLVAIYGKSYASAEVPVLMLLATAMVHMSGQAGAQRLSITRLRTTAIINALWAVALVGVGLWLIPRWGAAGAATAFLAAHIFSSLLANVILYRHERLPVGYLATVILVIINAVILASLAYARAVSPGHAFSLTLWLAAVWIATSLLIVWLGIRQGSLPRPSLRSNRAQRVPSLSET